MSSDHRNALPPGYPLQEYRIESVLGHGGFGITYLARDTHLEQWVAIKEYLPNAHAVREGVSTVYAKCSDDEEAFQWGLQRFILEARTLAHFHHSAIVRVLRFFEENRTAYMVMEYQDGESLGYVLKQRCLEEKELLAIIPPILDGLEKVHEAGFLHRDIKPNNIFIRRDGSPVLLDFGSARYAMGSRSSDLTSIVSPGYAPFEQYDDKSEQGPWTDIYALGAVMYHAITGAAPPEVVGRLKHDQMPRAVEVGAGRYRLEVLQAVDWALALDEEARPRDISEWRTALLAPPLEILPKGGRSPSSSETSREAFHSDFPFSQIVWIGGVLGIALLVGGLLYREMTPQAFKPPQIIPPPINVESPDSTATSGNEAPRPAPLDQAELQKLINGYFNANARQAIDGLMDYYAEGVDYLGWGRVPRQPIRQDKLDFFARWPEIRYELIADPRIIETPEADEIMTEFVFDFRVSDPVSGEEVTGKSKYIWRLRWFPEQGWKIVVHKEKVLTRDRRQPDSDPPQAPPADATATLGTS